MKHNKRRSQNEQKDIAGRTSNALPQTGASTQPPATDSRVAPSRSTLLIQRDELTELVVGWRFSGLRRFPTAFRSHTYEVDDTPLDIWLASAARAPNDYREQYPLDKRSTAAIARALRIQRSKREK